MRDHITGDITNDVGATQLTGRGRVDLRGNCPLLPLAAYSMRATQMQLVKIYNVYFKLLTYLIWPFGICLLHLYPWRPKMAYNIPPPSIFILKQ